MLRPGDADAESGPLLLSIADYIPMAGGVEVAGPCLDELAAKGRIVEHLDVPHITFPPGPGAERGRGRRCSELR